MPPKDRDVWDPPEDRKPEEPSSAFLQHFQNRAVRVGKDGKNAQLVRVRQAKPIKWTEEAKDASSALPLSRNVERTAAQLPQKRGWQAVGIVPPKEFCKRALLQQQHINNRNIIPACSGSPTVKPLNALNPGGEREESLPYAETPENTQGALHNAVTPKHSLKMNGPRLSRGSMKSAEVVTVGCPNGVVPWASSPDSNPSSNVVGVMQKVEEVRRPLGCLFPRSINAGKSLLMPQPLMHTQAPSALLEAIESNGNGKTHVDHGNNNGDCHDSVSTDRCVKEQMPVVDVEDGFHKFVVDDGDTDAANTESLPLPLYQPTGIFFSISSAHEVGSGCEKKLSIRKRSVGGGDSVGGKKGPGTRSTPSKVADPSSEKDFSNSAPIPMSIPRPARLQSLPQQKSSSASAMMVIPLTNVNGRSGVSHHDKNDGDGGVEGNEKKHPVTYKPRGLKEYRRMMNDVANLKLGGLGPADTDEQREARKKMLRQREYGGLAEKQAAETIREKRQKQQQRDTSSTTPSDSPMIRQNPPPPERVQAQERRARALQYARNLPRPLPSSTTKPHMEIHSSSSDPCPALWRLPQDEAAWRREKHIVELELRHDSDRERVATMKRQLGF